MKKEDKELVERIEALGFTWEVTAKNKIKALAPDGEILVFSMTGPSVRGKANQLAMLKRWENRQRGIFTETEEEQEVEEPTEMNDLAMKAFEAMVYTIKQAVATEESDTAISHQEMEDLNAELDLMKEEVARLEALVASKDLKIASLENTVEGLKAVEAKFNSLKGLLG